MEHWWINLAQETSALLRTNSSQEYEPHTDRSATPHPSVKRVLSYSTLRKRSVFRAESISSAESDLPSRQPKPGKRGTKRGSNTSPNLEKRCVTRAMVNGEKNVDYSMKYHPMDDVLRPKAAAKRLAKPKSRSPSLLPKKRYTTRGMVHGTRNVDYDMKHHPMDDLLHPKAAKKRSIRAWASSASSNTSLYDPVPTKDKAPMPKDLGDPFANPVLGPWEVLEPVDRRVYIVQKGAPSKGNTLPHTWPKVANLLVKEQYFTRQQFNTWGGIPALEERYETVRGHMMTLFGAAEEPMEEGDFALRYSEGFDVYDLQPRVSKSDGTQPSSVDGSGTDLISYGSEDVEVEDESEVEGITVHDMDRYDVYDMIQNYIDAVQDNQAISQPQTAEIRLSDELSLHTNSNGEDDHHAGKQRSVSGTVQPLDQKTGADRGMAPHGNMLFQY